MEEKKRGRKEKEECRVTPLLLFVEQFSYRAMDCAGSAVPPLCPPVQVTKAHFGDFAGKAEKASVPHFPYFIYSPLESIVYEMAWHIYERCIQELINWKICLSSAFLKSLCTVL